VLEITQGARDALALRIKRQKITAEARTDEVDSSLLRQGSCSEVSFFNFLGETYEHKMQIDFSSAEQI
jgi:hypothetical protein